VNGVCQQARDLISMSLPPSRREPKEWMGEQLDAGMATAMKVPHL